MLDRLTGTYWLIASLLYGSGLRLLEACQLRIKDIDLERHELVIRDGKGRKDRRTVIAEHVIVPLRAQLHAVHRLHQQDLLANAGHVALPSALARKYPNAEREWLWQWAFPATRIYIDPNSGRKRRHHIHESAVRKPSRPPPGPPESPSAPPATASATASQPTSSSAATTSARSKNSSATTTSRPPKSTPTS